MTVVRIDQYITDEGLLSLPEDLRDFPSYMALKDSAKIISLGNLRSVKGGLSVYNCPNLQDTGDLEEVNGPVSFIGCPKLSEIKNLKRVFGAAVFVRTLVKAQPDSLVIEKFTLGLDPVAIFT